MVGILEAVVMSRDYRAPMGFATGFLLVVSAGLIVSGYTPARDDLWIILP